MGSWKIETDNNGKAALKWGVAFRDNDIIMPTYTISENESNHGNLRGAVHSDEEGIKPLGDQDDDLLYV